NLDGLTPAGKGNYFLSDFISGKIMYLDASGKLEVLLTTPKGANDILFLADSNLLLVPSMNGNKVIAYNVK
ncbi:MAG: ATP-binding protein, partial [Candidatus Electrothrix sp. MAN1_4]|nr:ATP-binding protein [Candidatus Electrothrix sp. MAN1_4]